MAGVQKHGEQEQIVILLALGLAGGRLLRAGEVAREVGIARHAHAFKTCQAAVARFENGHEARGGGLRHIGVRGGGKLGESDLVMPGDALKLHALHDVHQRDDRPGRTRAAGAPGAVDIAFMVFRRLVEEHVGKGRDVDAARGNVRGNEILERALAHLFQHGLAPALGEVGRKAVRAVAEALEHARHIVDVGLGIAENDGRGRVFRLQQAHEGAVLVHGLDFAEEVLHLGHMDFPAGEGEHVRLGHEFRREPQHMGRIGGREKAGMAPVGQVALDLLHVGIKADGEHAVRLVENEEAHLTEIKGVPEQVVEHAPRRAHDDLDPGAQGVHLFLVAHAAIDGADIDAGAREKGGRLAFHLKGKLARGHQHQSLRRPEFRGQGGEHGQQVAARLAAARARLHHDVAPGEQVGQGQGLDGHELLPAGPRARGLKGGRQIGERHARERIFRLADGNVRKPVMRGGRAPGGHLLGKGRRGIRHMTTFTRRARQNREKRQGGGSH